jgi:cysteine/O-acetylserine efflux protein
MVALSVPLVTYIFITTFTPGPNNLTATAAGLSLGLKKSLPYLCGMAAGFFVVMALSAYFNLFLQSRYSGIAAYIKWLGFIYMLWLCVSLFVAKKKGEGQAGSYSFVGGLLLQLMNPKVIIYGVTLYGMFSKSLIESRLGVLLSALGLAGIGSLSILTWCLAGSAFNRRLTNKKTLFVFNAILALLLLYSAISIILG